MRTRATALLFTVILFATATSHARVFRRLGHANSVTEALQNSGGTVAYHADVTINGGEGDLTVLGIPLPLNDVRSLLRSVLGDQTPDIGRGGVARAVIARGGTTLHLLAFHIPLNNQSIVVTIEQSAAEAKASRRATAQRQIPNLPIFPDSSPHFHATDNRVDMHLNVSRTAAEPATVYAWYQNELTRRGWRPALPGRWDTTEELRIYQRGLDVCCVQVTTDDTNGNLITLLHKRPSIE